MSASHCATACDVTCTLVFFQGHHVYVWSPDRTDMVCLQEGVFVQGKVLIAPYCSVSTCMKPFPLANRASHSWPFPSLLAEEADPVPMRDVFLAFVIG